MRDSKNKPYLYTLLLYREKADELDPRIKNMAVFPKKHKNKDYCAAIPEEMTIFAPIKIKKRSMTRKNVTTIGLAAAKLMGINRTHILESE